MKLLVLAIILQLVFCKFAPHTLIARRLDGKNAPQYVMSLNSLYANSGATSVYHCSTSNIDIVQFASFVNIHEALTQLTSSNLLKYAERDPIVHSFKTPNDPFLNRLWGMNNTQNPGVDIEAGKAWDITTGSDNVVVAVIDTGADYTHPDLKANIWTNKGEIPDNGIDDDKNGLVDDYNGYNFVDNQPHPMDDQGHGTHCSGTIGAIGNNKLGVVGVNWKVKIMALKFLDSQGSGQTSDAIKCVDYAVKMKADLSSNSWGGAEFSQGLEDAIKAAKKKNQLFVVAAGNDGKNIDDDPVYPASYKIENVLAVAAHDSEDQMAYFSNFGVNTVAIAAPGVDIFSLAPGGQYQDMSGTSQATPHVAGIAALVLSHNPSLRNDVVKFRNLLASEDVVNKGDAYEGQVSSGGRISAFKALKAAKSA